MNAGSIDQNELLFQLSKRGYNVDGLDGDESPEVMVAHWVDCMIANERAAKGTADARLKLAVEALERLGTGVYTQTAYVIANETLAQLKK